MPRSTLPSSTFSKMSAARWKITVTPAGVRSAARYWRGLLRSTLRPQAARKLTVASSMPLLGSARRSSSLARRSAALAMVDLSVLASERGQRRQRQVADRHDGLGASVQALQHHRAVGALALADEHRQGNALAIGVLQRAARPAAAQV